MTDTTGASDDVIERFDPSALELLLRLGKAPFLVRMIDIFLSSSPERLRALSAGMEANDLKAVEVAAHSVKSSAGQLGGVALQQTAAQLEQAAVDGDMPTLNAGVEIMNTEFGLMRIWLEQMKADALVKESAGTPAGSP